MKISLHDKHLWQTVADQEVAVSRILTKAFIRIKSNFQIKSENRIRMANAFVRTEEFARKGQTSANAEKDFLENDAKDRFAGRVTIQLKTVFAK